MQNKNSILLNRFPFFGKVKTRLDSFAPFLFSALLCQEIFCPIHGGSYYVNISLMFTALILFCHAIFNFEKTIETLKQILPIYWVLIICIFLSYINSIFYVESFSDFGIVLKGTIVFIAESALVITATLLFKSYMRQIMEGLFFGIIFNLFVCLFVYFFHLCTGYVLTFYDLFPRDAFYIPNGGTIMFQGLFLEPSQLTNALLPAYFVLFGFYKDRTHRIILFLSMSIIFLFSGSGNVLVFFIGHLIAILFSWRKINDYFHYIKKRKTRLFLFVLATLILAAFIVCIFAIPATRRLALAALRSINPVDSGNTIRLSHMEAALEIFLKNPWGIGFNLTGLIMTRLFPEMQVGTAFNLILARFVELGIVGGFVYFLLFAQPAFSLLCKEKRHENLFLAISLIVSILLQFLNGRIYLTHYLVLGIAYSAMAYQYIDTRKIRI